MQGALTSQSQRVLVRLRAGVETFRSSLFFLPAVCVAVAVGGAELMLAVDARVPNDRLPGIVVTTVESARVVLGTIAAATITVAGTVFSVTMVAFQLSASQFSPRVLRGFLRDRFQQFVMGFVLGNFAYCLIVLRALRSGDADSVPGLSIAFAVVLGVLAVVAILGYVDRAGRSMQVGEIIRRITDETLLVIDATIPADPAPPAPPAPPLEAGAAVRACETGWVQQVSTDAVLDALAEGMSAHVLVRPGQFVARGEPLAVLCGAPAGAAIEHRVRSCFEIGRTRTMQQDVEFGVRQLVDIGLRALSPGINDPMTAYEVIVHLRPILLELLTRPLLGRVVARDGCTVVRMSLPSHADYLEQSLGQLRHAGRDHLFVATALLDTLGRLVSELRQRELEDRIPLVCRQGQLVLEECRSDHLIAADITTLEHLAAEAGLMAPSAETAVRDGEQEKIG